MMIYFQMLDYCHKKSFDVVQILQGIAYRACSIVSQKFNYSIAENIHQYPQNSLPLRCDVVKDLPIDLAH